MPRSKLYQIELIEEPEGGYTVIVPGMPGCITYGEDVDEAILMAKEAIELHTEELLLNNEDLQKNNSTEKISIQYKIV